MCIHGEGIITFFFLPNQQVPKSFIKALLEPGMVTHVFKPRIWGVEEEDQEFKDGISGRGATEMA